MTTGTCNQLDLLFVIDDSRTMGEEQAKLARAMPALVNELASLTDGAGIPVELDVQVHFTTTDMGSPLCEPFQTHEPERGSPVRTGCNARIERFTTVGAPNVSMPEACTDACPVDVEPVDSYVAFRPGTEEDNVPDGAPHDVDGDGRPDGDVAQALACLAPQGLQGCGYEMPLESMLQALNPVADWNQGPAPSIRESSLIGIVVVTDEADCSVKDPSLFSDPAVQNVNPDTNLKQSSSAVCWNAGVTCQGPDAGGVYTGCTSSGDDRMLPVSRYVDYLVKQLVENRQREVIMLGIVGVPPVTAYSPDPPFGPVEGGHAALVIRDWRDPEYPAGDILPAEWAEGVTAAHKQWELGIGPGCTADVSVDGSDGQGIPPVRIAEVCEALNDGDPSRGRCCLESICAPDYAPAMQCLVGMLSPLSSPW